MTHHYTILHGGRVLVGRTGVRSSDRSTPTAIAYASDRILAVGPDEEVLGLAGPDTRVVDLRGLVVVPGFHDLHAHPLLDGLQDEWLDLRQAADLRAALRAISQRSSRLSFDEWVEARCDSERWPERRAPTRDELDRAAPDRPVLLLDRSGKSAVASSLALAMAGIDARSIDRPGLAELARDEHGEPTGEIAGLEPLSAFSAALPPLTAEAARNAVAGAGLRAAAAGITSIHEADLGFVAAPVDEIAAYAGAIIDGAFSHRLGLRVGLARLAGPAEDPPTPEDMEALIPPEARGRLTIAGASFQADAAFQASGERLPEAVERLREPMTRAMRSGWRLAISASTAGAFEAAVTAYRGAFAATMDAADGSRRHRLDLTALLVATMDPRSIAAVQELALQLVVVGAAPEATRSAMALAGAAVPWAFGTDRPFGGVPPLEQIATAADAASRLALLHAWTAGGAIVEGSADGGQLSVGYSADLVILSADPGAGDIGAPQPVRVVCTVVGGRASFDPDGLLEGGHGETGSAS